MTPADIRKLAQIVQSAHRYRLPTDIAAHDALLALADVMAAAQGLHSREESDALVEALARVEALKP